ncbi:MTH [Lepeophtheirus salmonis]|uniref:MTH n=1 Tax=Lepeophtheirus salmonis TaxID=72036 RepID=A0A7R8CXU4_LEPSM|nr:MTH [Lepeophtheirus salmonis]CAF2935842.1 MTH [Lepeophtheirus salmonis]
MVYFKNADCLACSNQMYTQEDGFCYDPYNNISLFSMHRSIYSETTIPIERSIMKNYFNFGVPDSLSIMITFGLDSSKIMYSADSWFHNCPANHIWDPFSKCCRKIFCNIGSQVNKCDSSPISEGTGFNSLVLPSKEVHINLTAQVIMFNNTLEEVKNTLEDIFFSKFANTFSISMSRLSHIHVQYVETRKLSNELLIIRDWITSSLILIKEGIWRVPTDLPSVNEVLNAFNVILDISTESYEYSTQDLLASLVDLTMQNNFIISLSDEAYVSITSIQENSFYDQEDIWFWCRGGTLQTYLNEEFEIKINKSLDSDDLGNGLLSFNGMRSSERKIKFIGPKRFGVKENLEAWEYTVHPSGVEVCIELDIHGFGLDNIIETWLSLILRNLPGLNLMGLVGSTFAYQLLFITGAHRQTSSGKPIICILIAITIHFLTLVMFSWTNIIAWDLYKTFGKDGLLKKQRPKQTFMKYLIYSISLPSVIVGMAVAFNNTGVFLVDYVPFVLSTILNLVLYILTTMNIHKTATGVQNNRFSSSLSSIQSTSITSFDRRRKDRRNQKMKNVIIYIRMFSVLGITWFIGIIGMFIKPERSDIESVLMRFVVYSHVICNGLYGVFIFHYLWLQSKDLPITKIKIF